MHDLTTCQSCKRLIATDFSFCPYCGAERAQSYEFRKLLDEPFDRMEGVVQEYSLRRLESLSERLDDLEIDLNDLLRRASSSRR